MVIVDDVQMAQLNQTYLQRQGPTNVIAFPMREGACSEVNPLLLGDVVISMQTCAKEGQQADIPVNQRFYQLLVHGILHLFGYDHVHAAAEAKAMETKSHELLALIDEDG